MMSHGVKRGFRAQGWKGHLVVVSSKKLFMQAESNSILKSFIFLPKHEHANDGEFKAGARTGVRV